MRLMTMSCWKSFLPNSATLGPTQANSFITTVQTPTKNPGLKWPSRMLAISEGGWMVKPWGSGYSSLSLGANTTSQPAASSASQSASQVRG